MKQLYAKFGPSLNQLLKENTALNQIANIIG